MNRGGLVSMNQFENNGPPNRVQLIIEGVLNEDSKVFQRDLHAM